MTHVAQLEPKATIGARGNNRIAKVTPKATAAINLTTRAGLPVQGYQCSGCKHLHDTYDTYSGCTSCTGQAAAAN